MKSVSYTHLGPRLTAGSTVWAFPARRVGGPTGAGTNRVRDAWRGTSRRVTVSLFRLFYLGADPVPFRAVVVDQSATRDNIHSMEDRSTFSREPAEFLLLCFAHRAAVERWEIVHTDSLASGGRPDNRRRGRA